MTPVDLICTIRGCSEMRYWKDQRHGYWFWCRRHAHQQADHARALLYCQGLITETMNTKLRERIRQEFEL